MQKLYSKFAIEQLNIYLLKTSYMIYNSLQTRVCFLKLILFLIDKKKTPTQNLCAKGRYENIFIC